MNADEAHERNESLRQEAEDVANQLSQMTRDFTTWNLRYGRIGIRRSVTTGAIFGLFMLWHFAAFVAGVLMVVLWDSTRTLGVALTVGALFGIGSFISQVWSQGMNRERDFIHRVEHEGKVEELRALLTRWREIEDRLSRAA